MLQIRATMVATEICFWTPQIYEQENKQQEMSLKRQRQRNICKL